MAARTPLASVRLRATGTSAPAAGCSAGLTAYTLKFSSPPASCAYRTNFASRLQKYWLIGRLVSAVIGRALSNASSARFTQMLRVPLNGFRNEMNRPSGEICAPAISGSPKKSSRSMIGGTPLAAVCACAEQIETTTYARASATERKRFDMQNSCDVKKSDIIMTPMGSAGPLRIVVLLLALVWPMTQADLEQALSIGRGADAERARFHRPYVIAMSDP